MADRCRRAAAEHYMKLGTPEALTIAELQRKHGIPHRTSLVRMLEKMKDANSFDVVSGPHIRLTQDDVARTDLNRPGTLKKLLRKLHQSYEVGSGQTRRAPGAACTRCHRSKKSCDGFPCSNCLLAGVSCVKDGARKSAENIDPELPVAQTAVVIVNPEPPVSQSEAWVGCSFSPPQLDPMRPSLGGMGMLIDVGWKPDVIASMIGSCPLKLRNALDRLSCVIKPMLRNQAAKRKPLPELNITGWKSAQVARTRYCRGPDGSTSAHATDRFNEIYSEISKSALPRVLSCLVWSGLVWSGLVWSGLVLSGMVVSCLVLSCLVLSCPVLSCLVLKQQPFPSWASSLHPCRRAD
eukprot:1981402-Rhodomonas_salina.1